VARRRGGLRPRRLLASSLIVLAGLGLAWFAAAATLPQIEAHDHPERADALGLTSADALASGAGKAFEGGDLARAERLARQALAREPVNDLALRTLAQIAVYRGDPRAPALFGAAESLSRRDSATQMWMMQNAQMHGDVPTALLHFDRAMRTSRASINTLTPVLVFAAADPRFARQLGDLLGRRPPWWSLFLERFLAQTDRADGLFHIALQLHMNLADRGERDLLQASIFRLSQLGAFDQAYALYRTVRPAAAMPPALIRDGGFADADGLAPFEWSLVADPDLSAFREGRPAEPQNIALHLVSHERAGETARQLLLLPPGHYALAAVAGNVAAEEGTRPAFSLACAPDRAGNGATILTLPFPAAGPAGARFGADITIPANCPAQLLRVMASANLEGGGGPEPWLDDVAVARR
jgi:hypothetical protein